jgi:hypothetical protein
MEKSSTEILGDISLKTKNSSNQYTSPSTETTGLAKPTGTKSKTGLSVQDQEKLTEPLLQVNQSRFVLFPIKYDDIW